MQIQINTDRNVEGHEALAERVKNHVEKALKRFSGDVTRVEVHLSDENADKSGSKDKRCVMEARFRGRQPVAVTEEAASVHQAVSGAANKLVRLMETTLGRSARFDRTRI